MHKKYVVKVKASEVLGDPNSGKPLSLLEGNKILIN
jgi:hypothetical protein